MRESAGCFVSLLFWALGIWILYTIGGWVLSTFGIVGLVIFIVLVLSN